MSEREEMIEYHEEHDKSVRIFAEAKLQTLIDQEVKKARIDELSELDEIMLMIRVNRNSEVGKMKHRNIRYAIQTLINSEVASAVNGTLDRLEKKAETYHHNYTLNPRGHVITEAIPLEAINEERP